MNAETQFDRFTFCSLHVSPDSTFGGLLTGFPKCVNFNVFVLKLRERLLKSLTITLKKIVKSIFSPGIPLVEVYDRQGRVCHLGIKKGL